MDKQSRREAVRTYKEAKIPQGIYAVRCAGDAWVGVSRNLAQQQNGVWFSLKMGGHPNRALQAAWAAQGAAAFRFEVVEVLDTEDLGPHGLDSLFKDRERHWMAALAARKVVG